MPHVGHVEANPDRVRGSLARILASRTFARSRQLRRFIELTVEWTLDGRADDIKETAIAIEAYGRRTSFDPRIDPIIRTEARRLRTKLREYYQDEGKEDPVRIEYEKGSYVPRFIVGASATPEVSVEPSGIHRGVLVGAFVALLGVAVATTWTLSGRSDETEPARTNGTPRVLVLPLEDLSPNESNEDFALAITDSILARLSRIENLEVVSRRSVPSLAGDTRSPSEIAVLFSADYVLGGSLVKVGTDCRVAAELVRAADNSQVWADTFDFAWSDVFQAQDSIASRVSEQIAEVRSQRSAPETASLEAYESYVKGHYSAALFNNTRRQPYFDEAQRRLSRAIALDPEFADAQAELGELYYMRLYPARGGRDELLAEGRKWLEGALALDPENVLALSILGQIEAEGGRTREAVDLCRRAVGLRPSNAQAQAYLGERYAELGFYESAIRRFERATELDPLYLNGYVQMVQYAAKLGRWDMVGAAESRLQELFPGVPLANTFRGEAAYRRNDLDEAARFWDRAETVEEHESLWAITEALLAVRRGDEGAGRAVLEEYRAGDVRYLDHLAEIAALLGEIEEFVFEIERNPRYRNYRWLATNPNLARIAGEPAFAGLAESLYLQWLEDVAYYRESLTAPPPELPEPDALVRSLLLLSTGQQKPKLVGSILSEPLLTVGIR